MPPLKCNPPFSGRSKSELDATVKEIEKRGGEAIAIVVDHNQDEEVKKLFERIDREQNGKLDILVNNAYAGVSMIMEAKDAKFWDLEPERTWDCINGVGLRNHYICTVLASR